MKKNDFRQSTQSFQGQKKINKYDKNTNEEKDLVKPYCGRHHTVLLNNIDK